MASVAEQFEQASTDETETSEEAQTTPADAKPTGAPIADIKADATPAADVDTGTDASADSAPADDAEPVSKPRDWSAIRDAYAKKDEKIAKRLARYSSVESALDALVAAQNKIASGAVKSALPEKATPEQLAEWREQNGIPATPDGYELEIPTESELTEDGKAFIDTFINAAHGSNVPPSQANQIFKALYEHQQATEAAKEAQEESNRQVAEEELRSEWGNEYRLNSNLISGLLDTAPAGVKEELFGGRLADGTPVSHSVPVMRWLASLAREVNPVSTVVPGSHENPDLVIANELASIQKLMGDHDSEYWKGPKKDQLQARYMQLVDAQSKYAKRK